jgi:[acyl-carrier-protein] S-malonyltransferase
VKTIGVVFPGQGSQATGMGVDVAAKNTAARECFERASTVLGYDLLRLCERGTEDELRDTRVSQPAIFTANVAIYRAVESLGFRPIVSAGHSFGEYCSLTISGAISFDQAVDLVNRRGLAMVQAADFTPGGMTAIIGFERDRVEALCGQAREESGARVDIANLNAPIQIVVSGDVAAVERAAELARAAGAKRVVALNVSGAWHSALMEPAVAIFAPAVAAAQIDLPEFSVISNVDVVAYDSVERIRRCLVASLCSRVRWHETAQVLASMQPDLIVECGATRVLAPIIARLPGVDASRVVHVADSSGVDKLAALRDSAA